jgi:hypothetical protein
MNAQKKIKNIALFAAFFLTGFVITQVLITDGGIGLIKARLNKECYEINHWIDSSLRDESS